MTITRRQSISALTLPALVALLALTGCANDTRSPQLGLGYNGSDSESFRKARPEKSEIEKNYALSVLSNEPRVLIAKPKPRTARYRTQGGQKSRAFGGADRTVGGATERTETVVKVPGRQASGLDGAYAHNAGGGSQSNTIEVARPQEVFKDIVTPVSTVAYGDSVVVIKSINGGFGILLMKQGIEQNMQACNAFFNSLPSKSLRDVENAALNSKGLFRPTYWLDRRREEDLEKRPSFQVASAEPTYLTYLFAEKNGRNPGQTTGAPVDTKCPSKVRNYNYSVSHALMKRLGLFEKRGPFLAAWKDDGGKAMILDLSLFETRLDFDEALSAWMKMIIREPKLWEGGIRKASFKQRLRRILNKGGDTILSLLTPASVNAHP